MSWICPKCNKENDDIYVDGIRIRCICGYEPVAKEVLYRNNTGWLYFMWACPQDV